MRDWTADATADLKDVSTTETNNYYTVLGRDEFGNVTAYDQKVAPIIELAGPIVDGVFVSVKFFYKINRRLRLVRRDVPK
ncbi:MAG: hypothetical protein GY866_11935 [Proteobacteria bacterium]|nr:hypothetical protein [Pseudomonadota bacterium]